VAETPYVRGHMKTRTPKPLVEADTLEVLTNRRQEDLSGRDAAALQVVSVRGIIEHAAVERAPTSLRCPSASLLEEECHVLLGGAVA